MHACLDLFVHGMLKLLCLSVVALESTWAANLLSCTNNKVLITLGGPFYGSFAALSNNRPSHVLSKL